MIIKEITKGLSKALTPLVGGAGKELSGYLADHIRFFRWKSAVRIVERANQFSRKNSIDPSKVPIKFIVPFLEAASLEDTARGKAIADMWASLLASTIDKHESRHITYIDVLRRSSSIEAKFLSRTYKRMVAKEICNDEGFDPDLWNVGDKQAVIEDFVSGFEDRAPAILKKFGQDTFAAFGVAEKVMRAIVEDISYRADISPILYEIAFYEGREMINGTSGPFGKIDLDIVANLTVLGLMERFEVSAWYPSTRSPGKTVVRAVVSFAIVTSMGFDLMKTCCARQSKRTGRKAKVARRVD